MRRRPIQLTLAVVLLVATTGCEEDSPVVLETGTARLFPSSPGVTGFRRQDIKEAERFIQAAKWEFESASFSYPGVTVDLAATPGGEACDLRASIEFRDPTAASVNGACRLGVVIDSIENGVPATLDVTFKMTVYRAEPDLIQEENGGTAADWDGDMLPNESDPCPIIKSRTVGGQDIGNCSFVSITGQFQSDQDADDIADPIDNCVWVPNPGQANGVGGAGDDLGIPDGIGDACVRQEAVTTESITIPFGAVDLVQPQNVPSFVVLDFDLALAGLSCDWEAGTCNNLVLDESTVGYCITTDPSAAAFSGCS